MPLSIPLSNVGTENIENSCAMKCRGFSGNSPFLQLQVEMRLELLFFLYTTLPSYYVNHFVLMITGILKANFREKRKEVCIKTRSTSASRSLRGWVGTPNSVKIKWSIKRRSLVRATSKGTINSPVESYCSVFFNWIITLWDFLNRHTNNL